MRGTKIARVTTFRTPALVAVAGFPMELEI
jgi:hypothetical protein